MLLLVNKKAVSKEMKKIPKGNFDESFILINLKQGQVHAEHMVARLCQKLKYMYMYMTAQIGKKIEH